MNERVNAVTFKGSPVTLVGPEIKVGDKAPSFKLVGNDLADVDSTSFEGKVLVLSVVLSLDTPVCNTQTRVFNEKAAGLSEDVQILAVSLDLPFAQARFCGAEGIERVTTASDYKYRTFGEAYGVFIREFGLLARAVFVIDAAGRVVYVQYVPEATDEPDYDVVLDAVGLPPVNWSMYNESLTRAAKAKETRRWENANITVPNRLFASCRMPIGGSMQARPSSRSAKH